MHIRSTNFIVLSASYITREYISKFFCVESSHTMNTWTYGKSYLWVASLSDWIFIHIIAIIKTKFIKEQKQQECGFLPKIQQPRSTQEAKKQGIPRLAAIFLIEIWCLDTPNLPIVRISNILQTSILPTKGWHTISSGAHDVSVSGRSP